MTRLPSFSSTVPSKRPCTESYLNWYTMYATSMKGSFTATTTVLGLFTAARHTRRPMRPKPLMPMRTRVSAMVLGGGGGVLLLEAGLLLVLGVRWKGAARGG